MLGVGRTDGRVKRYGVGEARDLEPDTERFVERTPDETSSLWDNKLRQAYIQQRVNGDDSAHLTDLARLQFRRYRYETGQAVQNYVDEWDVDDDLPELAGRLADATGDDVYTRLLGGYI